MRLKLFLSAVCWFLLTACSKEVADELNLRLPGKTADPFSLAIGTADININGSRSLSLQHARCFQDQHWLNADYRAMMLTFTDTVDEFVFQIVLYSNDTLTRYEMAPTGNYKFRKFPPAEQDPGIDKMALIYLYYEPGVFLPLTASSATNGEVIIYSNDNDILIGEFSVVGVGEIYYKKKHYYNLRGSFKAPKL